MTDTRKGDTNAHRRAVDIAGEQAMIVQLGRPVGNPVTGAGLRETGRAGSFIEDARFEAGAQGEKT